MSGYPQSTPDFSRYTEATRRELYDAVVRQHFAPIPSARPEDYPGPSFTPEAAELGCHGVVLVLNAKTLAQALVGHSLA